MYGDRPFTPRCEFHEAVKVAVGHLRDELRLIVRVSARKPVVT